MPERLFQIADKHGIGIEYWDLKPPLEGVYLAHENIPPYIGIAKYVRGDKNRLRCILAEELGHHFTSVGSALPKEIFLYSDRMWTSRVEYRAMKWAAQFLLPLTHIRTAFNRGMFQPWEIADYFGVTPDFVKFRLSLPDIQNIHKEDKDGEL